MSAFLAKAELQAGNRRFVAGKPQTKSPKAEELAALAEGQSPLALVLTCSDSRVAPELLFDQGLGRIFTLRVAGNVLNQDAMATLEYGVEFLQIPYLLVLGHSQCGAVQAALEGRVEQPRLLRLLDKIQPAVAASQDLPGDRLEHCAKQHALNMAREIALAFPRTTSEAAYYQLTSGLVEWL